MKEFFFKIYTLGFLVLTVFFMFIIWKVTFHHIIEERHHRKEIEEIKQFKEEMKKKVEKTTFEKVILESEERIKHYLGYRILEEQRIEGHFHHIDFDIGPDKRNYCITCHGDIPHDTVRDLRAFLNMHAYFISCQTCHVKLEGEARTGVFKWYDRATGEIIESKVQNTRPGRYKAKIVPFERLDGKLIAIDSQERIAFALEFRDRKQTLTEAQKSRAKKIIHKIVSKQPHICEDCHQSENPLLPLDALGYPKERKDSILGTEVIGMINKYTEFYMPKMLHPGEAKKTEQ
jgi:hypothetical protein